MSEQQVIGGFEPNDGNFNPAFEVITRKRTSADNAWEGLKADGETEYHVYDKHWSWVPVQPTLETMLTEWRDLTARAQAAQAEADALFEHAGQCHGEIVVRLAELGWGAPRMVPGEPVVTLDESEPWIVNDLIAPPEATHYGDYWINPYWYYFKDGMIYVKDARDDDDTFDPREIDEQDRTQLIPSLISRPSAQQ